MSPRLIGEFSIKRVDRATFPGIDIFPVIIELQRCEQAVERSNNVYQYYDLWQLHPADYEDTVSFTALDGSRTKDIPVLSIRGRDIVQLRHVAEVKIGL
jgi:hypothetical protein